MECIRKLHQVLGYITNFNAKSFVIDKCFRLDGKYKSNSLRRILCTFNWYHDVQVILKNRKQLPRGVFVSEDLPEEWMDRGKVLRPIFMAAKKSDSLKHKTYYNKDKLIIDGKPYSVAPETNIDDANSVLDISESCQRSDSEKIIFLGCHSIYSNLFSAQFQMDNTLYNSVEQRFQSEKAAFFNDDATHFKIMREQNPFKIKRLGSNVKNFNEDKWKSPCQSSLCCCPCQVYTE